MTFRRPLMLAAAAFALAAGATMAAAGPVYDGKTVTLIVPNSPSGHMTLYARTIAPYVAKHIGAKEVRVENQQGAGGLKGTNNLWNAKPDGMTIAFTNIPTLLIAQIAESPGVRFDANKFTYLGRVVSEARVVTVGAKNERLKSAEDLKKLDSPFVFASQGTDEDFYTMVTLADTIGFPLKIVTGYEGNADTALAVIKGDADGHITSWTATKAAVEGGDKRVLLVVDSVSHKDIPNSTPATSLVTDPKKKEILEAIIAINSLSRSFFGPPNMDEAATKEMRAGIMAALKDPELLKEAEQKGLLIDPAPGEEQQARVAKLVSANKDLTPVFKKALQSIQ